MQEDMSTSSHGLWSPVLRPHIPGSWGNVQAREPCRCEGSSSSGHSAQRGHRHEGQRVRGGRSPVSGPHTRLGAHSRQGMKGAVTALLSGYALLGTRGATAPALQEAARAPRCHEFVSCFQKTFPRRVLSGPWVVGLTLQRCPAFTVNPVPASNFICFTCLRLGGNKSRK